MFFSRVLPLSVLALLPIAFAAPTPIPDTVQVASSVLAVDWIPVEFEGKTLHVNSAAIVDTSVNPARKAVRALLHRSANNRCGASTFEWQGGSWPYVSDCQVIQNYVYGLNTWWNVWNNTPDTHGLWYYGSCVFEAGTQVYGNVDIGSSDIGDLISSSIDQLQYNPGLVGAHGSMQCEYDQYPGETATTNWTLKHS